MRRIALRRPSGEKLEPVLEPIRVRHRPYEYAVRSQHACDLLEKVHGEAHVLEQFTGYDDVEGGVLKWKRFLNIPPDSRDAALSGALERFRVNVQPDDVVSWKEALRHRAGAAPEIQHAFARPANRLDEQRQPFWHENALAVISPLGVMLPVPLFEAIAHVACKR